jgi:prephenate dehydrogenase
MAKTRITIVGCGFTGTAIALALRNVYKDVEIIGHDKDTANTQRAEKMKAIDHSNWNLPAACENSQLIVLAIPANAIEPTLQAIAPDLIPGAIVTDTCSVKLPLIDAVKKHMPAHAAYISSDIVFNPARFSEAPAIEAITADIFKGAAWTLTPIVASPEAVDGFAGIVSTIGAMPIFMDAVEHDGLRLAVDSVPAALSSALMLAVTDDIAWRERLWLAGTTFGSATANVELTHAAEVASALVAQPEATTHWLNQIMLQLIELRDAVEQKRADKVEGLLVNARERRSNWTSEWYKGRDQGHTPADVKRPSILGMVVGERMANRLEQAPSPKDRDKRGKK